MMYSKKRLYFVVHSYLKPMQIAVQCTHSLNELYKKYGFDTINSIVNDDTIIILNGGTSQRISSLIHKFNEDGAHFAGFEEPDIGDQIVSICVVADPDLIQTIKDIQHQGYWKHETERELAYLKLAI